LFLQQEGYNMDSKDEDVFYNAVDKTLEKLKQDPLECTFDEAMEPLLVHPPFFNTMATMEASKVKDFLKAEQVHSQLQKTTSGNKNN